MVIGLLFSLHLLKTAKNLSLSIHVVYVFDDTCLADYSAAFGY